MRYQASRCIAAAILSAALAVPAALAAQDQQRSGQAPTYTVINLGTALGGTNGSSTSINDLGFVSGSAFTPGSSSVSNAVLWIYEFPFSIGTLGGANSAQVFAGGLNDRGELVGISETADPDPNSEPWSCAPFLEARQVGHACVGFAWRDGTMSRLPTFGGTNGFAAGVNNLGQVAGWAETTVHDPSCTFPQVLQFKAAVWGPNGTMEQLPGYRGDPDQAAVAINDEGQVVGVSGICGSAVGANSANHALLWDHGTVTSLGSLGGNGWDTPDAINNNGEVVGFTNVTSDVGAPIFHAFLWTKSLGRMVDLKTLAGDEQSEAESVNDQGQIVGVSFGAASHAFLYEDGVMMNLQDLIPPDSGLVLTNGAAINNQGWITANANDSAGNVVSVLLIPVGR